MSFVIQSKIIPMLVSANCGGGAIITNRTTPISLLYLGLTSLKLSMVGVEPRKMILGNFIYLFIHLSIILYPSIYLSIILNPSVYLYLSIIFNDKQSHALKIYFFVFGLYQSQTKKHLSPTEKQKS